MIRFAGLVLTAGMSAITLIILVIVILGMGWVAVAIPVLLVIGLAAVGSAFWRRWRRSSDASKE